MLKYVMHLVIDWTLDSYFFSDNKSYTYLFTQVVDKMM